VRLGSSKGSRHRRVGPRPRLFSLPAIALSLLFPRMCQFPPAMRCWIIRHRRGWTADRGCRHAVISHEPETSLNAGCDAFGHAFSGLFQVRCAKRRTSVLRGSEDARPARGR
jgi:hypothetical protein